MHGLRHQPDHRSSADVDPAGGLHDHALPVTTPTPTTGAPSQPGWTTTPKAGSNQPRVPEHMPMLVAIRTGRHDGYDRVVLEFRNDLPSWQVGEGRSLR